MKRIAIAFLGLLLLATACTRQEPATPTSVPEQAATPVSLPTPSLEPSPTPTAEPTATAQPTPIPAVVEVQDQPLAEDGRLVIATVSVAERGWLVIHAQRDGEVAEPLGFTAVDPGVHQDVIVEIDPLASSSVMVAMLHVDGGEMGVFEPDNTDIPLVAGAGMVLAQFEVESQFTVPSISVSDQTISEDGLIQIDRVFSAQPGWVVIQVEEDGEPGAVVGFGAVREGSTDELAIAVRWRESTARLYAVLLGDEGRSGRLDEEEDPVVMVSGEPVMVRFEVVLPPDIYVIDQTIVDGQVIIERVTSQVPGWLVVYNDNEGLIDRIIGSAPLQQGVNEQVVVTVVENMVTPVLHILLHEDTEAGGPFDFPGSDGPLTYEGRVPAPIDFRTNPGNYLVTRDQSVSPENDALTVSVPLVMLDEPGWVVIQRAEDGETGQILGYAAVPAGLSREVEITIDLLDGEVALLATLHLNAGDPESLDFPDGADVPFRYSGRLIQSPFTLSIAAE